MAAPFSLKKTGNRALFVFLSILLSVSLLMAFILSFQVNPAAALGNTYYVDQQAAGAKDGSSWTDAFSSLQPALEAAGAGDQIWVATGIYTPTDTADRTATFQLKKGVELYGGFEGGEDELDERDWQANPTVLSGDLDGNDLTDARGVLTSTNGITGANAYHVLVGSAVTQTAALDGFFITGGKADGSDPNRDGGGMWLNVSNPSLNHLWLSGNQAANNGGGLFLEASSPTMSFVSFTGNTAGGQGGGLSSHASSPVLSYFTFSANQASTGGGFYSYTSGSPSLTNGLFNGNYALYGSAFANSQGSTFAMLNLTIAGNAIGYGGGAIYTDSSSPTIVNCILWGNAGEAFAIYGPAPTVSYSTVQGGYPGTGNISVDPLFVAPVSPNPTLTSAGNYRLRYASPAIDAGLDSAIALSTDLDGSPRKIRTVDQGAYENQIAGAGGIIYVDKDATGLNNGASWTNAYTDLQSALSNALFAQVWVAEGVYFPASDASDRSAAFLLKKGVSVYGGFAGGETLLSQRNWQTHLTILSADLDHNDLTDARGVLTSTAGILGSNAFHVFAASGITQTAVLDGFFITGGRANASGDPLRDGGGLWLDSSNPSLANLWFSGNQAGQYGGGLFAHLSSPAMSSITFSGNAAGADGGGMYASSYTSPMSSITFTGNQATLNGGGLFLEASSPTMSFMSFTGNTAGGQGGGLSSHASSPVLSYFTFSANQASTGGGFYSYTSGSPSLTNGLFNGNYALYGSAFANSQGSTFTMLNLTIAGNAIGFGGGAIYTDSGSPIIVNCILWGNAGEAFAIYGPAPTVSYSTVQGGYPGTGNISVDPLFVAPVSPNPTLTSAGNYRLRYASPAIDAGLDSAIALSTDLDGSPRKIRTVDQGAYENQIAGAGGIIYVDKDATGLNNGASWTNAYTDLQSALSNALFAQVWVAEGVYFPASDASDRSAAFLLKKGVSVYGGFAGGETLLSQRNWQTHLTILSGDLDHNDLTDARGVLTSTAGILGSNAFHVFAASGITQTAVLDGFFITGGRANASGDPLRDGGGLWLDSSNPSLANLWFSGNQAGQYGGGLFAHLSSPAMSSITFSGNAAGADGGGMYASSYTSPMSSITFTGNQATLNGGGLFLEASSPTMSFMSFTGNTAGGQGGGLSSHASSPVLSYFTFSANQASTGGGFYSYTSGSPTLTNGLFNGNYALYGSAFANSQGSTFAMLNLTIAGNAIGYGGGAIYTDSSSPTIVNCILWGNAGEAFAIYGPAPTVSYSTVQGGYPGTGNISADPLFVAPLSPDLAPTSAGNYRLRYGSPAIDAGLDSAIALSTDLDGQPRKVDGSGGSSPIVDMGVYEWQRYLLTLHQVGSGTLVRDPDYPAFTTYDTAVITATPSLDWNFAGWSGDITSGDNPLYLSISGNTSLTATFTQASYLLNVSVVGAGQVSKLPDLASYPNGTVVTLTASSDPGWSFAGWSGAETSSANPLVVTITDNTALTATFTQNHYLLNVPVVGDGHVSKLPDQPSYVYGTVVTLTASADPGWSFSGWSGDRTGSANPLRTTITANTSITSTFTQDHYRLNLSGFGMGSLNITPRQTDYLYGTVITLTATPDPGWNFAGWTGAVTGQANPLILTITHDINLVVHFSTNWVYLPLVNKFKAP